MKYSITIFVTKLRQLYEDEDKKDMGGLLLSYVPISILVAEDTAPKSGSNVDHMIRPQL